ncbi:MAG: septum formation initiator family protein [Oscillospiraceae bacterium]|nr:septum formation initiator family protein [Oscillospiraceae bacterium]
MKMTLKSGFITKLVLLLMIVYLSITLINTRGKIQTAGAELESVQAKVAAQELQNAELRTRIENKEDEDTWLRIAKERLGLTEKGETVFYDSAK